MNFSVSALGLFLLASVSGLAIADTGPRIPPCEGCPTSSERPYPRSGFWFDPQRSGSGFTLEVQQGTLAGAYYGFDESGARIWYTFSGTLQPSEVAGEQWTLEADLLAYSGGSCIDCEHQPNDPPETGPRLQLSVLQRNLISFSLDGGDQFRVQPLIFGSEMIDVYPETSDQGLPRFPGLSLLLLGFEGDTPWNILVRDPNRQTANPREYIRSLGTFWTKGFIESQSNPGVVFMLFNGYPRGSSELLNGPTVQCSERSNFASQIPESETVLAGIGPGVFCVIRTQGEGIGVFDYFFAPLSNFGDDYFFATTADGRVMEGHRLLYR